MFKLKNIESKYRYTFFDDLLPYEHIKNSIEHLSDDILKIERIKLQSKDKEVSKLCDKLNKKLCDKLDYFKKKYAVLLITARINFIFPFITSAVNFKVS